MQSRPRVAIVTNVIPHYRADFYRRIFEDDGLDCHVFCQQGIPGSNIETADHLFPGRVTLVPSLSADNERIGWQAVPASAIAASFDMCFVCGNPRVVSNILVSCTLRNLGLPVVIWGQAHTAGASPSSERIRLTWWRAFSNLFVYNDNEVGYLRERGFTHHLVVGMNNGLDQHGLEEAAARISQGRLVEWQKRQGLENKRVLLSCARLMPKNRFDMVIDSLPELLRADPAVVWCVLGDGAERGRLEQRARSRGVSHAIRWLGAVYDEDALAPWFLSSVAAIHPGAIGLALLHAFGYGLPVVTHDDRSWQMPEIAALQDNSNGLLFRHGDLQSFVAAVTRLLKDSALRHSLSERALYTARYEFNTEIMARRFSDMVHEVSRRQKREGD